MTVPFSLHPINTNWSQYFVLFCFRGAHPMALVLLLILCSEILRGESLGNHMGLNLEPVMGQQHTRQKPYCCAFTPSHDPSIFDMWHPQCCKMILHHHLDLDFSNDEMMTIFSCVSWPSFGLPQRNVCSFPLFILIFFSGFVGINFVSTLCTLNINPLFDVFSANIFSHSAVF